MTDEIQEVHGLTLDRFVDELLAWYPDVTIEEVLRRLEHYEVDTAGEWRLYWPGEGPWFVADRLSERAARILERIMNDSRFQPSVSSGMHLEAVQGGNAVAALPRRASGLAWNYGVDLTAPSDRSTDGKVTAHLARSTRLQAGVRPQELEQADPSVRVVLIDSVD